MKDSYILKLYKSTSTIFTTKDISLIWGEVNLGILKSKVNYYVKTGKLLSLRKGIYAKDENYSKLEFATKIYSPSYVSLETVLRKEGVIFQYYESIFVVSYLSREIACAGQKYVYKKIRNEVLMNALGIEKKDNYAIATKERAFLDTLYLIKNYHFDNLKRMNWETILKILPIYQNKRMTKVVNVLYRESKHA